MKQFVYLSDTKLDTLHAQLPISLRVKLGAEVEIKAPFVSGKLKAEDVKLETSKFRRLSAVTEHLKRQGAVGQIGDNLPFFEGTAAMRFGLVRDYASGIAFFGGEHNGILLSLIGSRSSVIGSRPEREISDHTGYYYTLKFLNWRIDEAVGSESDQSPGNHRLVYHNYAEAMRIALKAVPNGLQDYEFMAIPLHSETGLMIATPVYVALTSNSLTSKTKHSLWQRLKSKVLLQNS